MRNLLWYATVQIYNRAKYPNQDANLFAVNLMPFLPSKHLSLTIATAFEGHDEFWPSTLV